MSTANASLEKNAPLALVTGASGGIGLEFARQLAAAGHDLVLVARSEAKLRALADELESSHSIRARVVAMDLGKPHAASELAAELDALGLAVDVLINNAGFGLFGEFVDTELDEELAMIQLNIVALTELSKHLVRAMKARGRGQVLNVASTAAFQPGPLMAVYYATKAYVLSFSEALAAELEGSGVSVTALCPGPTTSGFQAAAQLEGSKLIKGKMAGAAEVATHGMRALARGKAVAIPGAQNWMIAQTSRLLPRKTVTRLVKRVQAPV
ncbi:SDR family oxidoreductase [Pseudenhygromyxa sp. WMMC2535]|uniref:SDR family NAD(P)-dependent oxidoreductase n=1 Tax=Pseudenhygromyxa sp. WMMC2535 TaxID=2712867 RepID=UPI001554EF01|nr:SDR family oxidoreductase [Pseudenhygromyxa sp. WMMC2535]NVB39032.1 SDR family oxidoreductase [Pseudenhygromyxa sp. WMMC2535]